MPSRKLKATECACAKWTCCCLFSCLLGLYQMKLWTLLCVFTNIFRNHALSYSLSWPPFTTLFWTLSCTAWNHLFLFIDFKNYTHPPLAEDLPQLRSTPQGAGTACHLQEGSCLVCTHLPCVVVRHSPSIYSTPTRKFMACPIKSGQPLLASFPLRRHRAWGSVSSQLPLYTHKLQPMQVSILNLPSI